MTGSARQVLALVALRWQALRGGWARAGLVAGVAAAVWAAHALVHGATRLPPAGLDAALAVAPAAYVTFGVLALAAPLTSGGGGALLPASQLAAFPVRARTEYLGGLLLAPLNLVWLTQLVVLLVLTAALTRGGSLALGATTTAAYVACLTVLGQLLAWLVLGLRRTRRGRRLVAAAAGGAAGGVAAAVGTGGSAGLLEATGARALVDAVIAAGARDGRTWTLVPAVLLAVALGGLLAGDRACAWALRRPGDAVAGGTPVRVRRRRPRRSALRELVALDRASAWRAPALRRGGLVLGVLPGLLAFAAQVPWHSLVVLPGLVAAGAGLLFGVNAFCLDGPGAVWLASLPHPPALAARAKLVVVTETVAGAVVLATVAGALRSPGSPTAAEVAAVVASAVAATAVVVALCLRASVHRPAAADLRGPRDAVASPGALVLASLRLALPTAAVGIALELASRSASWPVPLLLAAPVVGLAGLSVARSLRAYADPHRRAAVVRAVAAV